MILLNRSAINYIYLTLTEKTTISSPTYLFEFVNDVTRESIVFIATDSSSYTDRYNKFTITETSGTQDLLTGTITLSETGFYSYRVFQQSSTTNLIIANTGAMVESGKLKVNGSTTTHATYDNQPKRFVTYG